MKKIKLDEEIREKEFNMYGEPTQILGIKKGTNTGLATGDYDQGMISLFKKKFYKDLNKIFELIFVSFD